MREKLYFVYILTNFTNSVMYVGVTNNIKSRVYKHKQNRGSVFTSKYNINKLVYYEMFKDIELAILREKSIKNLIRDKKIKLIKKFNPKWNDLYDEL
ncbi:MAG: GIY-YIG nuclease family protein [Patescibacteria group bacterium]